jgi:hypothetical protein
MRRGYKPNVGTTPVEEIFNLIHYLLKCVNSFLHIITQCADLVVLTINTSQIATAEKNIANPF